MCEHCKRGKYEQTDANRSRSDAMLPHPHCVTSAPTPVPEQSANCRVRVYQGGAHDSNSAKYLFRVPMIHRFMTSHPVAKLLLCFGAKHQDGRPMLFGFFVILTNRLTELCILNAENVEKVSSRPFKQMS